VPHGISYAVENGNWFTRFLKKIGIRWVDKDVHITKDGMRVCGHWGLIAKNGFVLPRWFRKKYGKRPRLKDVVWADLQRLRTARISFHGIRTYRFVTLKDAMAVCAEIGMGIMVEQKGDVGWGKPETWDAVDQDRISVGLPKGKMVAATLPGMARAGIMLEATHAAGVPNMVIRAQDGVPRSWEPFMTWYRGKIVWKENR